MGGRESVRWPDALPKTHRVFGSLPFRKPLSMPEQAHNCRWHRIREGTISSFAFAYRGAKVLKKTEIYKHLQIVYNTPSESLINRGNFKSRKCVAVLQCCSSQIDSTIVKNFSIFIYKYRSIFRVWEIPLDNCNTATLQQQRQPLQNLFSIRNYFSCEYS